jgi:hypothetical protein
MTVDGWTVSPEQVSTVLQQVDIAGEPLGTAVKTAQGLVDRRTDLMASGRSVIADAWDDFLEVRALVPGMLIDVIASSVAGIVEGVNVIVAGDETMAQDWRSGHPELFDLGWKG